MNSSKKTPKNNLISGISLVALTILVAAVASAAEKKKGIEVEIPYEATLLKTSLTAPLYLNEASGGMVVSDAAGGVYLVTLAGKATELVGKSRLKHVAGVASAPSGFGTAGKIYALSSGEDAAGPCEVDAIDKSGSISTFAKLPDAPGGKPTD